MELLLILTYTAICVAVFKIFRIPVNKWTLPTPLRMRSWENFVFLEGHGGGDEGSSGH
jgi:hypothetical protein